MIAVDEFVLSQLCAIDVHDNVQADVIRDNKKIFIKNITKSVFEECEECKIIKDTADCFACEKEYNVTQEKIDGVWKLFTVTNLNLEYGSALKLIFRQTGPGQERILGIVAFPDRPFFDIFSKLTCQSNIKLIGWRNNQRHTLLSQVHVMEPLIVKQPKRDLCFCEICFKTFKTKGSYKNHERKFHRQLDYIANEHKQ